MSLLFVAPFAPLRQNRFFLTSSSTSTSTTAMTLGPKVYVGDAGYLAAKHVIDVAPTSVAVSGGSLPKLLAAGLKKLEKSNLPSTWDGVFLADERWVPLDHEDSNYRSIKQHLNVEPVPINPDIPVSESANDYKSKLVSKLGASPSIDCVLLGLGPDGHTCSLFPGHPLLNVNDSLVAHIEDSPKPPPKRITLTLSALEAAKDVVFVVTGEGKATVLQDILENADSKYPGALVRPKSGNVTWFLDEAAASKLKQDTVTKA